MGGRLAREGRTTNETSHLPLFFPQEQQVQKLKNEKLRIAMMKLKEASVQKVLFINSFIAGLSLAIWATLFQYVE